MDAIILAGIAILIFGGVQFLIGLTYYSIMHVVDKVRARKYAAAILLAIQHRWQQEH